MHLNSYEAARLRLARRLVSAFDSFVSRVRQPELKREEHQITLSLAGGGLAAVKVAHYMEGMAAQQRTAWDAAVEAQDRVSDRDAEALMLQAGAAASEAMSRLLLAAVTGDAEGFRDTLETFVNDAVLGGIVPA